MKNKNDFGYQFTTDICNAISFYTTSILKNNKKAFIYRGSNLQYAIERCLYIQCINSKDLYNKYFLKKKNSN